MVTHRHAGRITRGHEYVQRNNLQLMSPIGCEPFWTLASAEWNHMVFPFCLLIPYPLELHLHFYPDLPPSVTPQYLAMLVVDKEEKLTFYGFPSGLSSQLASLLHLIAAFSNSTSHQLNGVFPTILIAYLHQ